MRDVPATPYSPPGISPNAPDIYSHFRTLYYNARSLLPKFDELCALYS